MAKKKTTKKATKKTAARRPAKKAGPDRPSHVRERGRFRALTLANPNYFGNLPDSEFKYVLQVVANTNYESIGCVGFQPQFERLEAVVYVHQPSGYGGGVCNSRMTTSMALP